MLKFLSRCIYFDRMDLIRFVLDDWNIDPSDIFKDSRIRSRENPSANECNLINKIANGINASELDFGSNMVLLDAGFKRRIRREDGTDHTFLHRKQGTIVLNTTMMEGYLYGQTMSNLCTPNYYVLLYCNVSSDLFFICLKS